MWVEVEGCFDVKARSEEEIRDLIEEGWVPADVRIPMKPAGYSDLKAATHSDLKAATVPI